MTRERGDTLLALARNAIAQELGAPCEAYADDRWLERPGACFVTLIQRNDLRGCIGSLEAQQPLREDVATNARAAAFRDPRFPPLTLQDYPDVQVEISLLSPVTPLQFSSEQQAHTLLRPGIDGVVLQYRQQRSTFLPQVWEQLPAPQDFIASLKQKAGLDAGFWHADLTLWRYTVEKWREPGERRPHRL